jgi:ribosomal protein L29
VKTVKLRELKKQELMDRVVLKRKELGDAKYDKLTGKTTDFTAMKKLRHEVARIETLLKEESYSK